VSADGSVIVGDYTFVPSPNPYRGFRNNAILSGIKFGWEAHAYAVSADGQTVVGESYTGAGNDNWYEATIWPAGVTLGQGLGRLGNSDSSALAISADGTTIVGESGDKAVRFSPGGVTSLGTLPGEYQSSALAVSADGSIVVGESGSNAFIWDESNGMRNLQAVLETDYGLDLCGWSLILVDGISDDGKVMVGFGTNPSGSGEAWMVNLANATMIPEPGSLVMLAGLAVMGLLYWRIRPGR
jgi:uncharacterized membrane protein